MREIELTQNEIDILYTILSMTFYGLDLDFIETLKNKLR